MAKRARGSITTRPGQRRPLQRSTPRPATTVVPAATAATVAPRPTTLTDAEEARAAELEAAIVAEERRADEAKRRSRTRVTEDVVTRPSSSLAVAAANEYGYVARDVRRIALLGGSLIILLLAIWAVSQFTDIGPF